MDSLREKNNFIEELYFYINTLSGTDDKSSHLVTELKRIKNEAEAANFKLSKNDNNDVSSFMKHPFPFNYDDLKYDCILQHLFEGKSIFLENVADTSSFEIISMLVSNISSNAGKCLIVSDKTDLKLKLIKENNVYKTFEKRIQKKHVEKVTKIKYTPNGEFIKKLVKSLEIWRYIKKTDYFLANTNFYLAELKYEIIEKHNYTNQDYSNIDIIEFEKKLTNFEHDFKRINAYNHPFNALNETLFESETLESSASKIESTLSKINSIIRSARQDILAFLVDYENNVEKDLTEKYLSISIYCDKIKEIIDQGHEINKNIFKENFNFLGNIFGDKKLRKQLIHELIAHFNTLISLHNKYLFFNYDFKTDLSKLYFDSNKLYTEVQEYQFKLFDWFSNKSSSIQKKVKHISLETTFLSKEFSIKLKQLLTDLETFRTQVNNRKIFKFHLEYKSNEIRHILSQLENLEKNVNNALENLKDFPSYYSIKKSYFELNKYEKNALDYFFKNKIENWLVFLKCDYIKWYEKTLIQSESSPISLFKKFKSESIRFSSMLEKHTIDYWSSFNNNYYSYDQISKNISFENLVKITNSQPIQIKSLEEVFENEPIFNSFYDCTIIDLSKIDFPTYLSLKFRSKYTILINNKSLKPNFKEKIKHSVFINFHSQTKLQFQSILEEFKTYIESKFPDLQINLKYSFSIFTIPIRIKTSKTEAFILIDFYSPLTNKYSIIDSNHLEQGLQKTKILLKRISLKTYFKNKYKTFNDLEQFLSKIISK